MADLTEDEMRALLRKADELIQQAQDLQAQLHRAMGDRSRADSPERRGQPERRKTPRNRK